MTLALTEAAADLGSFTLTADLALDGTGTVAVVGPSGAGKSTLLGVVGGFVPLRRGRLRWDGRDISGLAPGRRPVATVFQDNNLFPHLTVAQNVGLGIAPRLHLPAADRERVATALRRVGLDGLAGRKPGELSGGQQSRAALARVLIQDASVVCLDEAFAALGPALRAEMLDLVAELLAGDRLVLMVTHDPADARRIAPRALTVIEGRVTGPHGTPALLDDPPAALRDYLGT